jgi:hypothetical protein
MKPHTFMEWNRDLNLGSHLLPRCPTTWATSPNPETHYFVQFNMG